MLTLPPNGVHPGGRRARMVRRVAERLGFHAVPRHFYSVVPDLEELDSAVWERQSDVPGVDLHPPDQLRLLREDLMPYIAEFSWQANRGGPRLDPANDSYRTVDAEILYALVRHLKPRRLLELGSGHTTLISAQAAKANAQAGHPTAITAVDPYPKDVLLELERREGWLDLRAMRAQDLPLSEFTGLTAGDILFVDTSHTVKVGGEVNFVVLEVLPRLAPGVTVHFHDIFLPYEYPREWMERHSYFFNEQYLLQAFLAHNDAYRVILASYWLSRRHPDALAAAVPGWSPEASSSAQARSSSFWIQRSDGR